MLEAPDKGIEPSQPGWLGLEILDGSAVDWKTIVALGEGTVCVRVAAACPARKEGLRTKDYVRSINGIGFEAFHASGLQIGMQPIAEGYAMDCRGGYATHCRESL
jgi:hypothetical protein